MGDGTWRTNTIDRGGDIGKYNSLVIDDADGMLHLLYSGEGALWHAQFSRDWLLTK